MEDITLPTKVELVAGENPNEAVLILEPAAPGYGTTIGNALRRVLLSSLPGAAVTAVKIKGAQHEFTSVPNVKEDVLDIILNLKQLRLKVFSDEPVRLTLRAKHAGEVTARDIEPSSDVEILNPDLHIATLTDKNTELEMEIFAGRGRGYVPIEERETKSLEIGMIAIDALYSPVRNVGLKVENVRVGQLTNYDKLTLLIETDGTILPREAVLAATKILLDHFGLFMKFEEGLESDRAVAESSKRAADTKSAKKKAKAKEKEAAAEKEEKEEKPKKKRAAKKSK